MVDAHHAMSQFDKQFESVKQAAVADRIVLSKIDVTEPDMVTTVKDRLKALNPAAPVIESSHGDAHPSDLFGAGLYNPLTKTPDVSRWLQEEAYRDTEGHVTHHHHHEHGHDHGHDHGHHHHDVNRHDDHIRAFCLYFDEPFSWGKIAAALDMLVQTHGANLLRLKGLLNVTEVESPSSSTRSSTCSTRPPS